MNLFEHQELKDGEIHIPAGCHAEHRPGFCTVYRQLSGGGWGLSYEASERAWCRFVYPSKVT